MTFGLTGFDIDSIIFGRSSSFVIPRAEAMRERSLHMFPTTLPPFTLLNRTGTFWFSTSVLVNCRSGESDSSTFMTSFIPFRRPLTDMNG